MDIEGLGCLALKPFGDGYFHALLARALPGMPYKFRIDGQDLVPDLASRFQPEVNDGTSVI